MKYALYLMSAAIVEADDLKSAKRQVEELVAHTHANHEGTLQDNIIASLVITDSETLKPLSD